MNEEICCITNEGRTAKNEWEKGEFDFLPASYIVCKKLGQFFFHTLLTTVTFLNKDMSVDTDTDSCVTTYKYLNKLLGEV